MAHLRSNTPGYAHGFRPIEGNHPPPTPSDCQEIRAAQFSRFDSLSATTPGDNSASQSLSGSVRASVDSSKKRRRFPGPLSLLQQGSISGRSFTLRNETLELCTFGRRVHRIARTTSCRCVYLAWIMIPASFWTLARFACRTECRKRAGRDLPQHSGDGNDDEAASHVRPHRRRGDAAGNQPHGGVFGDGYFGRGAWTSLCSALDMPIPQEGASDEEALHTYLDGATAPISGVLAGDFDLRVPALVAVIDSIKKLSLSDVVVDLVDPSGRIRGYLHPGCMEDHGPDLAAGAAILLKEVSIFVSGPGCTRLLNIHPFCLLAIYAADTPLPNPERLKWLRACDPPFTPRHPSRPFESNVSVVGLDAAAEPGDGGIELPRSTPVLQTTTSEQPPEKPPEQRSTNPDSGSDQQRPIRKPPPHAAPPKTRKPLQPPQTVNFSTGVARQSAQERGLRPSDTGSGRETDASQGSQRCPQRREEIVATAQSSRVAATSAKSVRRSPPCADTSYAGARFVQPDEQCTENQPATHEGVWRHGQAEGAEGMSQDSSWWGRGAQEEQCSQRSWAIRSGEMDGSEDGSRDTPLDTPEASSSVEPTLLDPAGVGSTPTSTSTSSGPMRTNVHGASAAVAYPSSTARRSSVMGAPQNRTNKTKGAPVCDRADSVPGIMTSTQPLGARDPSRKHMMDTTMASAKSTSTSIWADLEGLMSDDDDDNNDDDDDGYRKNSESDSERDIHKRSAVSAHASIGENAPQAESRELTGGGSKCLIQNASQGQHGDCLAKANRDPGIGQSGGTAHGPAQTPSLWNGASLVGRASDASQAMTTERSSSEPPRKIAATDRASKTSVTSETSVSGGSSFDQVLGRSSSQSRAIKSPLRGVSRAKVGGICVFQMDDDILDAALDDSD